MELTESEVAYLKSQMLGRLATANPSGVLHVCPVGFRWNDQLGTIDIGGVDLPRSLKYRNVQANPSASLVVDDVASRDPWLPRGIELRGRAEVLESGGREMDPRLSPQLIRLHPHRIRSWGIDASAPANSRPLG